MNEIDSSNQRVSACVLHHHTQPRRRSVLFGLAALTAGLVFISQASAAEPGKIVVQVDKPGARISPMLYGLMTEEINYSYDGGLYGELIQNRIFRDPPGGAPVVTGTKEPGLFTSEHYSMSAFSCKIPNGKYLAKLYFAETYNGISGSGQRVFSFNVQGQEFRNFDIWAKAGGPNRACVETVPVEVTDGEFRIVFTPQIQNPTINAIEVIPQSATAPADSTIRIKAGQSTPFTDSSGQVWQPDKGFEGGDTVDHGPIPKASSGVLSDVPHWSLVTSTGAEGAAAIDTTDPINTNALTTSLKLTISNVPAAGRVGVANDGYWGIPVHPNTTYQASFYAKASDGFTGPLTVDIESNDGKIIFASGTVPAVGGTWRKYSLTLKTGQVEPTAAARFVISGASTGTLNFNLVSLFPPTYKDTANGNRMDIMQLLADMKPTFLRFPGGNYVEGNNYENRWDWLRTIGPLEERPGHMSPWGYRSTDGMGLLEYLEWCEDLHMEPVLAVFAAYTLNGRSYPDEYARFAQEAVDEIEYVTGDVNTKWGAQRAKDGHPAPFKLTYVEVGNEDPGGFGGFGGGEARRATYAERFPIFYLAIKAKYPDLQVISTTRGNFGNYTPDVIDEHYYMDYNGALRNAHLYDDRPRTTTNGAPVPRVFVGEWATRDNNNAIPTPTFHAALTDAAFLTGLERNADLVVMSCYAPLFVNVSGISGSPRSMQWATDLIGYNALTAFGSPSYYVQKMFYNNKGDVVLPITVTPQIAPIPITNAPPSRRGGFGGFGRGRGPSTSPQTLFASSSLDEATGDIILKVVNAVETPQQMEIDLKGAAKIDKTARLNVLTGGLTDVNSVEEPMKVAPKSYTIDASAKFVREFPGHTVSVIRFSTK